MIIGSERIILVCSLVNEKEGILPSDSGNGYNKKKEMKTKLKQIKNVVFLFFIPNTFILFSTASYRPKNR
jgi:hypothetical protein